MSQPLSVADLTPQTLEAASELLVAATVRRAGLAGCDIDGDDPGLRRSATSLLASALDKAERFALVCTDDSRVVGVVLGLVSRLTPQDAGYTYLPPRHTLLPQSGWATDLAMGAQALPALWAATRARSHELGLDRVTVQVLNGDWASMSTWRALGLRPDTVFAFRATAAPSPQRTPAVCIRPAHLGDLEALVNLSLEEHSYHARNTGSGVAADQSRKTVETLCRTWLDHDADEGVERAFVAVNPSGNVIGVTTVHVMRLPSEALGSRMLPQRYGYIGLTAVTAPWRGRGVGHALANRALDWVRQLPHPPAQMALHYVADNTTSAPFWSALGYAPAVTHLTNAPAHRQPGSRSTTGQVNGYNELAEFHDLFMDEPWARLRSQLRTTFGHLPETAVIAEVGAGSGVGTVALAQETRAEVVALEPSLVMRAVLTARVAATPDVTDRVTVVAGAAPESLADLPDTIDGFLCCHMLGHLRPEDRRALWEWLSGALIAGGAGLITVQEHSANSGEAEHSATVTETRRLGRLDYRATHEVTTLRIASGVEPVDTSRATYQVLEGSRLIREETFINQWSLVTAEDVIDELAGTTLELHPLAPGVALLRHSDFSTTAPATRTPRARPVRDPGEG